MWKLWTQRQQAKRDKDLGERWYNRLEKGRQSTAWHETQPIGVEYRLIDRSVQPIARPKCWWGPRQSRDTSISPGTHPSNHPYPLKSPRAGFAEFRARHPLFSARSRSSIIALLPSARPFGFNNYGSCGSSEDRLGFHVQNVDRELFFTLLDELLWSKIRGWEILKADTLAQIRTE